MKNYPFTFADITGDAADFPVHHFLVELFDVERLNSERQSPCQHGKRAHTSAHTHMRAHIYQENTFKCLNTCKERKSSTRNMMAQWLILRKQCVKMVKICHSYHSRWAIITQVTHSKRQYHLHRPDVHFGAILPVSQQLRGCVGRTSTLGAQKIQRQWFCLQCVAQAKVCMVHHSFYFWVGSDLCRYSYRIVSGFCI